MCTCADNNRSDTSHLSMGKGMLVAGGPKKTVNSIHCVAAIRALHVWSSCIHESCVAANAVVLTFRRGQHDLTCVLVFHLCSRDMPETVRHSTLPVAFVPRAFSS